MGIIQEEKIFLDQTLTTQKEVFEFLAKQAVETGISQMRSTFIKDWWKERTKVLPE